jgi:uncharacterized protein
MPTQFWINLPVKNVAHSKAFFTAMGFHFNDEMQESANSACMLMGEKNVVVMLFDEATYMGFFNGELNGIQNSAEVLLSFDASSKEEVDEIAQRAVMAGGSSRHVPSEMNGFMYGCMFTDIDGHKWNALYMDMSKMA